MSGTLLLFYAKLRLTTDTIKRLKPPIDKPKVQYFDTDLTGFMLEVKNTGTKTYYYRYRVNTSQKMIRIGTTTELNLQEAKEKYLELKERQENPEQPSPQKEKPPITFREFYDNYYLSYIQTHIKSYETNISIFNSWNTARKNANLPEVRIHDLRHTYASALVNAKCSLYEVQMLLGHSTAKMTQRYAHLSNESLMRASSMAGRLVK